MFALADVVYFFADEFPGLGGRSFSLPFVFARPFECFFFWHSFVLWIRVMARPWPSRG